MASKGQKFKKYSAVEKEEVLAKYINGYSARYLEEKYGISKKTIETWKQKVLHPDFDSLHLNVPSVLPI